MIFYVAAIAAVLLTGLFVFATEASSRAKLVVGGLVGVSVLIQFGVGASWALPAAIVVQAVLSLGIAFYLKFAW